MSLESDVSDIRNRLMQFQATVQQLTDDQFYANVNVQNLEVKTPTPGLTTIDNATPVVVALNQPPFPVSLDGAEATYTASILGLVPASLSTDIFEISGSATKTIKVRRIRVTGTRTTSASHDTILLKRSTLNSGGTFTNPIMVRHDTNNNLATAAVKAYTANPTLGTLIGNLSADKQFLNTPNTGSSDVRDYVLTESGAQPIFLRGINESVSINLNGVTMNGGNMDIWVEWTEV